jgi:hypothetical protein
MISPVPEVRSSSMRPRGHFAALPWAGLGGALLFAFACGGAFQSSSSPSDISGSYSIALTNQSNGCQFANWTNGSTASDVHFDVQQQGPNVSATVTGVAGLLFDLILGGKPQFQGTVTDSSFTMAAVGANSATDSQCAYTIQATMAGSSDGDTIQGQLTYTETTNGSPDCGYHATCSSVQSYAGARAPSADDDGGE